LSWNIHQETGTVFLQSFSFILTVSSFQSHLELHNHSKKVMVHSDLQIDTSPTIQKTKQNSPTVAMASNDAQWKWTPRDSLSNADSIDVIDSPNN